MCISTRATLSALCAYQCQKHLVKWWVEFLHGQPSQQFVRVDVKNNSKYGFAIQHVQIQGEGALRSMVQRSRVLWNVPFNVVLETQTAKFQFQSKARQREQLQIWCQIIEQWGNAPEPYIKRKHYSRQPAKGGFMFRNLPYRLFILLHGQRILLHWPYILLDRHHVTQPGLIEERVTWRHIAASLYW